MTDDATSGVAMVCPVVSDDDVISGLPVVTSVSCVLPSPAVVILVVSIPTDVVAPSEALSIVTDVEADEVLSVVEDCEVATDVGDKDVLSEDTVVQINITY